jgi:hypothetical protein
MKKCNYYVYLHKRVTDGKVFYVGKGSGNRLVETYGRNPHWKNVAKKHGWTHEILFSGLTEDEAFSAEIDVIAELEYFGEPLTNMTKGGDGVKGLVFSDLHRSRLSASLVGRSASPVSVEKLILNNKKRSRKIICVTLGLQFDSIKDAAEALDCTKGNICSCCKGDRFSTKGLVFVYGDS